jgi:hypothetical protein
MNDTHGETGKGWYGFDLDGTLAEYDGWRGIIYIGKPIAPMVKLIRQMHDEGKVVKIMTARVAPKAELETGENPYRTGNWCIQEPDVQTWAFKDRWGPLEYIQEWCYRNLGFVPEIVYQKDHLMLELYDDRVKQVVPNEGWLVEDIAMSKRVVCRIERVEYVNCKWYDRLGSFMLGMMVAALIVIAVQIYLTATMTVPEAERKLHDAASDYMQSKLNERVEGLLK